MSESDIQSQRDAARELLLAEFEYYSTSFWKHEQLGEQRVTRFVGFASVVVAALAAVVEVGGAEESYLPIVIALIVLLVLGRLTFLRVIKRNLDSDECKEGMALVRQYFLDHCSTSEVPLRSYLYFDPAVPPKDRRLKFSSLTTGGWLQTVAATNTVLTGGLAFALSWGLAEAVWDGRPIWLLWVIAVAVALAMWIRQVHEANQRYTSERPDVLRHRRGAGPLPRE